MKSISRTIFVFIIAVLTSCTNHIGKEIEKRNRQLPQIVSDGMRIDSLAFIKEINTLRFHYTVLDDSIVLNCDYIKTQKCMAQEIKKSHSMAVFRNQGVTIEYVYTSDQNKSTLLKIPIPNDMYK